MASPAPAPAPADSAADAPSSAGSDGITISLYKDETQLDEIMSLMAKDLSEPYSIFTYRFFLHGWPELAFVAHEASGRLIGAVIGKAEAKKGRLRGYIAMLAVDGAYRKHGLGLRLAATLVEQMSLTCEEVVLETEITNLAALRLYEKLGFVRDKRLPKYYMNGNDAFRLRVYTGTSTP